MKRSRNLSSAITITVCAAVFTAMLLHTLFEYFVLGKLDVGEVVTHHILPALFIALMIWATIHFLLNNQVVQPVISICNHLDKVGDGQFSTLQIQTNIQEVDKIVDGLNGLTNKLTDAGGNDGISKSVDDLVKLRSDLQKIVDEDPGVSGKFTPIIRDLHDLEGHLLSALVSHS